MEKSGLKKYLIILGAIAALALLLRLIAGVQMYKTVPSVSDPGSQTDMYTYIKYAKELSAGTYKEHDGAYYYQPFYYAVYLRSLFTVFGSSPMVIIISQALLGALTVLLTGLIGARLGGKKAGIIAAVIMTMFRNHILYTPYALIAVLQTFLITLAVFLLLIALEKKQLKYWAFCGLTVSFSILTRGNLILLIPFLLFFLWRSHKDSMRNVLKAAAVLLLCIYLPQLPFSLKNKSVTGKWTGPSTAGDVVLAIGNNPDSPPGTMNIEYPHYIQYDNYDAFQHWMRLNASGEKTLKSSMKDWVVESPSQWLELKFRTLSLFMSNEDCYNNTTLAQNSRKGRVPWLNSIVLLDFWVVGIPFVVLLLRILIKRDFKKRKFNVTLSVIVVYIGSIVLFYVLSRYKLPIVPLMAACAGTEIIRWFHTLNGGVKKRKILLTVLLIISTFFVSRWYEVYSSMQPGIMKTLKPVGSQFTTDEALFIKDHPIETRGGWQFELFKGSVLIGKKFKLEEDVSSSGTLRFLLYGQRDNAAKIRVRHAGRVPEMIYPFKKEGWEWVEIPLEKIVSLNKELTFEIEIEAARDSAVQYTRYRNYDRSTLNGQPLEAEWVIQLKIVKEKEN